MSVSVFKTEAAKSLMRTHYNQVLSRFPFGQKYVDTSYGKTFLLTAGQEDHPPVILLHGSVSNSAFWFPEIMALSSLYRVYAVDIIGEAGNSSDIRPDLHSKDFSQWMKEVLQALNITKAAIIGNSLGGWMALKFATAYPLSVSRLVLIATSGIMAVRGQFLKDVKQAQASSGTAQVKPGLLGSVDIPKEVLDFMNLIVQSYNPIEELPIFADEALRRLSMPVLFVAGIEDTIIDTPGSASRLNHLIPAAQTHLLPGVGHAVFGAIEYILPFLNAK